MSFRHYPWQPEAIANQMRVLWLIEQVRERRIGYGKASELAGIPRTAFIELMGRHQVSPMDYDPEELAQELAAAREVATR